VNLDNEDWLLIADTHVGFEFELGSKGIRIPRQTDRVLGTIRKYAEDEGVSSIAILGDIKHEIPSAVNTMSEIKGFLEELSSMFNRILLIRGNHDGGLDHLVASLGRPNVHMVDSRGILMESRGGKRVLLLHGNAKPRLRDLAEADVVLMGHTHPAIRMRDRTGYIIREPVIVKMSVDKRILARNMYGDESINGKLSVIILPTFNPLMVGVDVVDLFSSPISVETIINYIPIVEDDVEVYMTDMTYLGTLSVLRKMREEDSGAELELSWL